MRGNLTHKLNLLESRSVVNAALQNTATVTVRAYSDTIFTHCVEDELSILGLKVVEALLNDVVAVEILDKLDNLVLQGIDNHLDL